MTRLEVFSASPIYFVLVALIGISSVAGYTEDAADCYGNSSLHCLSTKIVAAFRKIDKIPEIPVTTWLSVVPSDRSDDDSDPTLQPPVSESRNRRQGLLLVLGNAISEFIESRSLRISLPEWATGSQNVVDLDVGRAFSQVTGRKKKGGMGMMMMVVMGKMMMMVMGMAHMKAMVGMMAGGMALMMTMMQIMGMAMSKKSYGGQTKHVVVVTHGPAGPGPSNAPPADTYGAPPPGNVNMDWNSGGGSGWNSGGNGRVGGYYYGGYGGYPPAWGNRAYYYESDPGLPLNNTVV